MACCGPNNPTDVNGGSGEKGHACVFHQAGPTLWELQENLLGSYRLLQIGHQPQPASAGAMQNQTELRMAKGGKST